MTPGEWDVYLDSLTQGAFSVHDITIMLPRLLDLLPGSNYVEIGVDCGKSLALASLATAPEVKVTGVDIVDTSQRRHLFDNMGKWEKTVFMHADSKTAAQVWTQPISLLFIDGDHSYEGCKADILNWQAFVEPGGKILFHDFNISSPGVMDAVKEAFPEEAIKIFYSDDLHTSLAEVQC